MMWELIKDLLLVSLGMGIGVVLMCIMSVGKEADRQMIELKESEERSIPVCGNVFPRLGEVYLYSNMKILLSFS